MDESRGTCRAGPGGLGALVNRPVRIVLASESLSRRRAPDLIGVSYEVRPSAIDEKAIRDSDPLALTRKLAEAKAY